MTKFSCMVSGLQGLTLQIEKDANKKNKILAVSNENKKWGKRGK